MGQNGSSLLQTPIIHNWILGRESDVTYDAERSTKFGDIRGKNFHFDGFDVEAYLGVPYGRCGVFKERFQKPKPYEKWEGVRDCTKFGPRSIQQDMVWDYYLTPVPQDEAECLNMNIFVPADSVEENKTPSGRPVMVFVHGGGYLIHSAANYGDRQICRNLCRRGVIVCVIQYRLGLLGFLSTGKADCPGNYGLWDQKLAFEWIRENIGEFGGDSNSITAVGQSAGAASIDLLSISPKCEGLIQRVILMGGNAASDWAVVPWKKTIQAAEAIARRNGWKGDSEDTTDLVNFLRNQPASRCRAAIFGKSAFDRRKKGLDFCPVIDGDFLPEPIDELRQKAKKVTAIIGTTDYEALLFVALGKAQADMGSLEKQLKVNIPDSLPDFVELRDEARDIYLRDVDSRDKVQVARAFIRMYSDTLMNNSTIRYAELMSKTGHTVFLYNLTYHNPNSFGVFAFRMPFVAPTHCYDIRYLFGKGMFSKFRPDSDDLKMLDIMTRMWSNFARNGDPNYDQENRVWHPVDPENPFKHLELGLQPTEQDHYQGRRAEFWRKVELIKEMIETRRKELALPLD
ncbi:unnamed protein product [Bursaphelenchus xylophilus]|uniref:(pine wood nematode) hypothetical protein n=1 Tax=Bursaphelenchus xylophilus TaxID=6326 RepID=A0A1I7SFM7_BURXY|nr:unnamed protein product [Bursaphelenchus xylophilus]CAG9112957.1 unnamed protein product [Bursaphelenchus xylophilus]